MDVDGFREASVCFPLVRIADKPLLNILSNDVSKCRITRYWEQECIKVMRERRANGGSIARSKNEHLPQVKEEIVQKSILKNY